MALDVRDARLSDLVDADAVIKQIATGCQFTEGTPLARNRTVPGF